MITQNDLTPPGGGASFPNTMTLTGLSTWQPPQPVILVADPDAAEPIAANYERACVIALPSDPAEQAVLAHPEAWGAWLPLMGADLCLWPVSALQVPYFAALVPVLRDAGIATLRLAVRHADDWARYERVDVLWRNARLHPGIRPGDRLTLQALRAPDHPGLARMPAPASPPPRPAEEVTRGPVGQGAGRPGDPVADTQHDAAA